MKGMTYQEVEQVQGGCCEGKLVILPIIFGVGYAASEKIVGNPVSLFRFVFAAGMGLTFALMAKLDESQQRV